MAAVTDGPVLVTGAAGFIGSALSRRLVADGRTVVGVDNLTPYYDVALKEARLALLADDPRFTFVRHDLADREGTAALFAREQFAGVVHLAAQPGVRYSIDHPEQYIDANLVGFANVLEGCRHRGVGHLVYASSSSVYGANATYPYREDQNVDHPVSLYAATKKANELMAFTYSHLYGMAVTGLRFFTVYGPWGRPDMAYYKFARAIVEGRPIDVYNHGDMRRDFTYVDDIVEGVVRVLASPPAGEGNEGQAVPDPARVPHRVYNIGNHRPVPLLRFIEVLEDALGMKAEKRMPPMQPGDVKETAADIEALRSAVGFAPSTPLEEGIPRFVAWFNDYCRRR